MKIFLIFMMIIFFSAHIAQTETPNEGADVSDEVTTEAAATDVVEDKVDEVSDETRGDVPECVCPDNQVQKQEASIFPQGSVFMVTPFEPERPKEPEKKNIIPGYIENLERGFDDKSYKQIPFKE